MYMDFICLGMNGHGQYQFEFGWDVNWTKLKILLGILDFGFLGIKLIWITILSLVPFLSNVVPLSSKSVPFIYGIPTLILSLNPTKY